MTRLQLQLLYRATKALRFVRTNQDYYCGYLPTARILWYINPKCAQSTIHASFQSSFSDYLRIDRPYHRIIGTEKWQSFGFVRNPASRFTSLWKDKVRNWSPENNPLMLNQTSRDYLLKLDNFIEFIGSLDLNVCEPHARKQIQLVPISTVKEIGRVEFFDSDWGKIMKKFGLKAVAYRRMNKTHDDVTLNTRQLEKVKLMYQDDYKAFKYD